MHYNGKVWQNTLRFHLVVWRRLYPWIQNLKYVHYDLYTTVSNSLKENCSSWSKARKCSLEIWWTHGHRYVHNNWFWHIFQPWLRICNDSKRDDVIFICTDWVISYHGCSLFFWYVVSWYYLLQAYGKEDTLLITYSLKIISNVRK